MTSRLGFEIVEKQPDALDIGHRREVLEQIGLATHDEILRGAARTGPAGQPGVDQPRGENVEFRLRPPRASFDFAAHCARVRPRMRALR